MVERTDEILERTNSLEARMRSSRRSDAIARLMGAYLWMRIKFRQSESGGERHGIASHETHVHEDAYVLHLIPIAEPRGSAVALPMIEQSEY